MNMETQTSEISDSENLNQWAAACASLFLANGERSGKLSDKLRENYTAQGIEAVAAQIIARTNAQTSGHASLKGFSTSVTRAAKDSEFKPLAVSFKVRKYVKAGSGKISKHLTATAFEREAKDKDAHKAMVDGICAALVNASLLGCDNVIEMQRNACTVTLESFKSGEFYCDNDTRDSCIRKLENTLYMTQDQNGSDEAGE